MKIECIPCMTSDKPCEYKIDEIDVFRGEESVNGTASAAAYATCESCGHQIQIVLA